MITAKRGPKTHSQRSRFICSFLRLIDELEAVKLAEEEAAQDDELRVKAKEARGKDPPGLPPYDAASRMGDT